MVDKRNDSRIWIPDLRCAQPGMTRLHLSDYAVASERVSQLFQVFSVFSVNSVVKNNAFTGIAFFPLSQIFSVSEACHASGVMPPW